MSTVERDGGPAADALGPTVPRMLLGIQLHRFREAAGVSPEQAGYEIRASRSKISRMENGRVRFKERDVTDLLTLYGITDDKTRAGMVALVRQANAPGWWSKYGDIMADWFEAYLGLEMAASVIRTFELQFVHGLFQTEDYARAVTLLGHTAAPGEEIDRRVNMRLKRQDLLTGPEPPQVWSVIDEGALRRPVGGAAVMQAQLKRLIEVAQLRHVTVQVVPFSRGGHAAAGRVVHRVALRRTRSAGRRVHRAAHQRPLPRQTRGRRPLHGGHEPPQHRSPDSRRQRALPRRDNPGDLVRDSAARRNDAQADWYCLGSPGRQLKRRSFNLSGSPQRPPNP